MKVKKITPLYPKFISHSMVPKESEHLIDRVKEIQLRGADSYADDADTYRMKQINNNQK